MKLMLQRGLAAEVDESDAPKLEGVRWYAHKPANSRRFYVGGHRAGRYVSLHRELVGAVAGQIVDHINGDTLDNRRSNLRIVTASESAWNRGRVGGRALKGISRVGRRWQAQIKHAGRSRYLGLFGTPEGAARAYDVAARELFGAHARPNEEAEP